MLSSPDAYVPAKPSFWATLMVDVQPRHVITAIVLLAVASMLSRVVSVGFKRARERHLQRGTLLPETATQLALTRRLLHIAIWVTSISAVLSQFQALRVISTGLLASAGLSGLIVGFAARSTLGNAIAGLTISITQPIRIGDDVELRGERGIVEDIHFTYTVLRLLVDGRRLIIPNDALANEVVKNATMGGVTRIARAEVLVPPGGSPDTVRSALLAVANGFEHLDRAATAPEVYYVRIDERGTLLRLVATCDDQPAADRLVQKALARASQVVFRRAL
ncbi:MAG: mechanosensitive ion channel family protein [Deltaproteobacteria bacterium]|nr:MAG: mechanosensitive ion channel family protein [Deltaproteobacteria bacterium]